MIGYIETDYLRYLYYKLDILNGELTEINLDDISLEFRDISTLHRDFFKNSKNVFLVKAEGIDDERFILEIWDDQLYSSDVESYAIKDFCLKKIPFISQQC